jgi:hypothetical protein
VEDRGRASRKVDIYRAFTRFGHGFHAGFSGVFGNFWVHSLRFRLSQAGGLSRDSNGFEGRNC